jgi:hypothetical protein
MGCEVERVREKPFTEPLANAAGHRRLRGIDNMKKHPVLMVSLCVLLALGTAGFAQAAKKKAVAQEAVPVEAKRYLGQGKAIMERAKSPQDYEEAIRVFEKAASLAPTWPDIYDDLAYAQESAEKYPEAVKSLRKYLTLAPSYVDKKNYEVRIYKLEEKIKYMAGPGPEVKLAQQLAGTWISPDGHSTQMEIEATGAKVRGSLFVYHPDTIINPMIKFDAVVKKNRLIGTSQWHQNSPDEHQTPLNSEINLSPDGRTLALKFGGFTATLIRK